MGCKIIRKCNTEVRKWVLGRAAWDLASRSLRPRTTPPERRRLSRRGFQTNQRSLAKALLAALRPPSPRQLISSSTLHPTVNNSAQNWPQEVVTGAAAPRLWHDL